MLKKAATVILLFKLFKVIKSKWRDHPFYKDGLIDDNGEPVSGEALQEMKSRKFDYFTYGLKKILDNNVMLKYSLISFLTSILFMRENKEQNEWFKIGVYKDIDTEYLKKGDWVIAINENEDSFHESHKTVIVATQYGDVITSANNIEFVTLEDIVTTQAVATKPMPLVSKASKKKKKKDIKAVKK